MYCKKLEVETYTVLTIASEIKLQFNSESFIFKKIVGFIYALIDL